MRLTKLKEYRKARAHYYSNSLKFANKGNFRKASEFLWGAITQSLKVVALLKSIKISKHEEFFNFVRGMSRELKDREMRRDFIMLNDLHENFYDEKIAPRDFASYFGVTKKFLKRLKEIEEAIMKGELEGEIQGKK